MNNLVNKLNSLLEITLTLCVFVSSILVLSIEKYWWGGSWHHQVGLRHDSYLAIYKQELYTINNLIRLAIVACSISFFMIITVLDLLQVITTFVYASW